MTDIIFGLIIIASVILFWLVGILLDSIKYYKDYGKGGNTKDEDYYDE